MTWSKQNFEMMQQQKEIGSWVNLHIESCSFISIWETKSIIRIILTKILFINCQQYSHSLLENNCIKFFSLQRSRIKLFGLCGWFISWYDFFIFSWLNPPLHHCQHVQVLQKKLYWHGHRYPLLVTNCRKWKTCH